MFDRCLDRAFGSREVAACIAQRCAARGIAYNNTKIQKLLYCVYGAILAAHGVQICREKPRAWPYGPVFPRVFMHIYKGYDIARYPQTLSSRLSGVEMADIRRVVDFFGRYSVGQLVEWSRSPGSPWLKAVTVHAHGSIWNGELRNEDIVRYFRKHVVNV
ncbi:MAG: DUF4065 domain-containing protein [Desulfovibrionaceae bacterium]|nr:DUF4065 domain-containing protein [Desulfovibrionaceae bacterium]